MEGLQSWWPAVEEDIWGWGFPGNSDGKESSCNAGDLGSIPRPERSPKGEHDNPLQYSCLENPISSISFCSMLLASVIRYICVRSLYSIDESCLENPMDRGAAWQAIIHGLQSRTRLKQCSMHALLKEFSFHGTGIRNRGGAWKPSHVCVQLLSHVWLFETPWTIARQASLSMGFSRQDSSTG